MIELQGVSHTFHGPAGPFPVLKDIDLRVERGESVALMGANGSGKSTVCRCANGLLVPEKGSVAVDGLSTSDAQSCVEIRRRVGLVFQDPSLQLVSWSVAGEIAFGPENLGWAAAEVESAVKRGLAGWGLQALEGRHPHHLSGGQMAELALASVLVMDPSYLVVDEPTSLLDRRGRADLLKALEDVGRDREVGLLWVTRYPEEALLCDRLVVLCRGEIVASGDPSALLARPVNLRTWGLEPTPAALVSHRMLDLGVGLSRIHIGPDSLIAELELMGLDAPPPANARPPRGADEPLLSLEEAGYGYDGCEGGVSGLSFAIRPGEGVGLAGPSGAGKSTAAYLASGALRPKWGAVRRGQAFPSSQPVGLCAQFPEEQFCASTVAGEVGLAPNKINGPGAARERALECLEAVGLDPAVVADRSPLSLSEGEKKKVALASALACGGVLLVLDEPTLGLDGPSTEMAAGAIHGHLKAGGGALIASHSGDFLLRATGGLVLLKAGGQLGCVTWEEQSHLRRHWEDLPHGQLLELCSKCGGRPESEICVSIDSTVGWLAKRFRELLRTLPERV